MKTSSVPYLSRTAFLGAACLLAAAGCSESVEYANGEIAFEPDRPAVDDPDPVEPYVGDNEIVLEAQSRFRTGIEFHQKVIWRTCTPNGGVCHNNKEYPDLRTPANFAAAFGAGCNVAPGEYQSVWDGCERPGDRFRIGGNFDAGEIEVGYIELIQGTVPDDGYGDSLPPEDAPGVHVHLASPIPGDRTDGYGESEFARSFINQGQVQDSVFARFRTRWWVYPDRTHVYGEVRQYQVDTAQNLVDIGIVEGDANRNGTFGAQAGIGQHKLLDAGNPEGSYLVGRLRGELTDETYDGIIPGSRMPLANQPFSVAEMYAFYCLVEQFPTSGDETGLARPIDYRSCSYTADPENLNLLGQALTWDTRISDILGANCGGCHGGTDPEADLNLTEEGAYDNLLNTTSNQVDGMPFITPGDPDNSYLFLKIVESSQLPDNFERPGLRMPINPLTGEGALPDAYIEDIRTWIINGAVKNE